MGGDRLSDRHRAAIAVVRMKWDEAASIGLPAVDPLLGALSDPKSQVRVAAVNALVKIGDERAIPPLIDMLQESDAHVQETAASALASIGDARAVMPLVALAGEGSVVTAAVKALDRLLERIVQAVPDADLIKIAALQGPAPQGPGEAQKRSNAQAGGTMHRDPAARIGGSPHDLVAQPDSRLAILLLRPVVRLRHRHRLFPGARLDRQDGSRPASGRGARRPGSGSPAGGGAEP